MKCSCQPYSKCFIQLTVKHTHFTFLLQQKLNVIQKIFVPVLTAFHSPFMWFQSILSLDEALTNQSGLWYQYAAVLPAGQCCPNNASEGVVNTVCSKLGSVRTDGFKVVHKVTKWTFCWPKPVYLLISLWLSNRGHSPVFSVICIGKTIYSKFLFHQIIATKRRYDYIIHISALVYLVLAACSDHCKLL